MTDEKFDASDAPKLTPMTADEILPVLTEQNERLMAVLAEKDAELDKVRTELGKYTSRHEVLRGFEVTKLNGAVSVGRYKPTELAARQAAADAKWLGGRHPRDGYQLRALLSVAEHAPEEAPMVLDADEADSAMVDANGTPPPEVPSVDAGE